MHHWCIRMGCTPRHPRDDSRTLRKRFVRQMKNTLPVEERYNSLYSRRDIMNPILEASRRREYVDQVVQDWKGEGKECPDGDSVFYRLGALSTDDVMGYFSIINGNILSEAKGRGLLPFSSLAAVDLHDVPYYGRDRRFTVGTKECRGTNYCHQMATLDMVVQGRRLCVSAVPVFQFNSKASILRRLTEDSIVGVGTLLLDRGFYTRACIQVLNELGIHYIIPAPRDRRISRLIRECESKARWISGTRMYATILDYDLRGESTTLVILYRPEEVEDRKVFAFITDLPATLESIPGMVDIYSRRWGIETAYRVRDGNRARTNTLSYPIRLMLLLLTVLVYNIWILANAILMSSQEGWDRYPVTMHRFTYSIKKDGP